jgi:hypothetical protein
VAFKRCGWVGTSAQLIQTKIHAGISHPLGHDYELRPAEEVKPD